MVHVKREGVILERTSLEFENEGVMNPAVIAEGNTVHMFYRAVKKGNYSSIGYCRLEGPLTVVGMWLHCCFPSLSMSAKEWKIPGS